MALHSKKDFAEMCGLTTGNLSVYEARRKVVYSGDYIDDSIELNRLFLDKRRRLQAKKSPERPTEPPKSDPPPPAPPKVEKPAPTRPKPPRVVQLTDTGAGLIAEDAEKARLTNEKLQLANEFMRKRLEKLMGESIPTELVKAIIAQLGRSFPTEYRNLWDQTMADLAKKYNMSFEDEAKYRAIGIESINKFTERAVAEAGRELKNLIQQISEKREVGERDL